MNDTYHFFSIKTTHAIKLLKINYLSLGQDANTLMPDAEENSVLKRTDSTKKHIYYCKN